MHRLSNPSDEHKKSRLSVNVSDENLEKKESNKSSTSQQLLDRSDAAAQVTTSHDKIDDGFVGYYDTIAGLLGKLVLIVDVIWLF